MNGYRGPQIRRQHTQTTEVFSYAGFTGTWGQYISASAGVPVAGFGSAVSYREQTVTAMLGGAGGSVVSPNIQRQTPMGELEAGTLRILTREKLSNRDYFNWRGVHYRVDGDSQPSRLNGYWMSILTRGT